MHRPVAACFDVRRRPAPVLISGRLPRGLVPAAAAALALLSQLAPVMPALAREAAARAATIAAVDEPAASHPFGAVDMQSMLRITEPQASPRGDLVAFVVRTPDFAANRGKHDLWLVAADGSR